MKNSYKRMGLKMNKDTEKMITYNDKTMSLNKLKLAHRDGKGTKVRV